MNETEGYIVFFFDNALEALGAAIKPYLREGPHGEHVLCNEIDTAGSLIEMTLQASTDDGRTVSLELMVPQQMVKMIVSARSEAGFGFSPRVAPTLMQQLPPVAGAAPAADAPPQAIQPSAPKTESSPANATTQSDKSRPPEG